MTEDAAGDARLKAAFIAKHRAGVLQRIALLRSLDAQAAQRQTATQAQVLALGRRWGQPFTVADVVRGTGRPKSTVADAIRALAAAGELRAAGSQRRRTSGRSAQAWTVAEAATENQRGA